MQRTWHHVATAATAGLLGLTALAVLVPDASGSDSRSLILAASAALAVLILETASRLIHTPSQPAPQTHVTHHHYPDRRVA